MKPFSLLIKPTSADCNLRCEYCFYIGHLENGSKKPRMTVETLESERDPNRVREIACNFSGMVYPDSNISIQLKKRNETGGEKEIFFEVYNHENQKAIRNGYILLKK